MSDRRDRPRTPPRSTVTAVAAVAAAATPPGAPPPLPRGLVVETIEIGGETLVVFAFPSRQDASSPLTETERDIVELTLRGLTTAQIAAERGVARATVSSQLQSIYRKLGVSSRVELACKLR